MIISINPVTHILKRTGKRKYEKVNFCNVTTEVIFQSLLQNITWLFAITS